MKAFDCPRRVGRLLRSFTASRRFRGASIHSSLQSNPRTRWVQVAPTPTPTPPLLGDEELPEAAGGRGTSGHLVAPMHLDQTTGRAELTEAQRQLGAISGCCARVCVSVVVMVQSGRSIPKTLSARIDFLLLRPWKRSCNTADPPSGATLSF